MKGNKKGQEAMEFLMTYGWAILVVLSAIGALAWFGVLSPENLLPDKVNILCEEKCLEQGWIYNDVYTEQDNGSFICSCSKPFQTNITINEEV